MWKFALLVVYILGGIQTAKMYDNEYTNKCWSVDVTSRLVMIATLWPILTPKNMIAVENYCEEK